MRHTHPDNIPQEFRYIPTPVVYSNEIPAYLRRDLKVQSIKVIVDLVWYKYRDKIIQTLWLVNKEQKTAVFRFSDIELNLEYKDENELNQWLNVQLLKFVGITLDLYYIFYRLYRRNVKGVIHWKGFSPQGKYYGMPDE